MVRVPKTKSILDVEVLLSNFEGRDRVSVGEFLCYAGMNLEEDSYRKGLSDRSFNTTKGTDDA